MLSWGAAQEEDAGRAARCRGCLQRLPAGKMVTARRDGAAAPVRHPPVAVTFMAAPMFVLLRHRTVVAVAPSAGLSRSCGTGSAIWPRPSPQPSPGPP